jgi:5-carboxymethyl-2-hydroxymuconate isomerase
VGDGRTNGYFVHLELRFLEGRSTKTKQAIGEAMRTVLREFFSPDAFPGLQITIEVLDIERKSYFKWPDNLS